ncbi:pentapeptide repeat-containing protein [Spirillospora sp. NPDC048911]|uniref:pentapeptide repeat-containing protein n=1 Tax=Spirillospora sp. NPDC048911 TaxID=3364527 RepID=UPI003717BF7D
MATLRPGADLDLRGCSLPAGVLEGLLEAMTGPDGRPHLGRSRFDGAFLPAGVSLRGVCFEGDSSFDGTCFAGGVSFYDARFLGNVSFRGVRFAGNVSFHEARFQRHASFDEAVFVGDALFGETRWHADASFGRSVFFEAAAFDRVRFDRNLDLRGACFGGAVSLRRVRVARAARFDRARFRHAVWLGPMTVGGRLDLGAAVAHCGLHVHATAREVTARGAAVRGVAEFRLREASLDLEGSTFGGPVTVRSLEHSEVHVLSFRRVKGPRLDLADVDLSRCRFQGTRLEQLRLNGQCTFAMKRDPWWHDPRWHSRPHAVLAEDYLADGTSDMEDVYRQLARATNGCLSQDFRYRALEIQRRSDPDHWRRGLLHLLWITCGYGLRAGRAAAWLTVGMAILIGGLAFARHGHHMTTAHPRIHRHSEPPARHAGAPRAFFAAYAARA